MAGLIVHGTGNNAAVVGNARGVQAVAAGRRNEGEGAIARFIKKQFRTHVADNITAVGRNSRRFGILITVGGCDIDRGGCCV